jgi:PAS domain S-box-containing protein
MDGNSAKQFETLLKKAEKVIGRGPKHIPAAVFRDLGEAVRDLLTSKTDLEMRCEELCRSQRELDKAKARYSEFYDLAPVGYLTIDKQGVTLEANLTAGALVGCERERLINVPFSSFLHGHSEEIFHTLLQQIFSGRGRGRCELVLKRAKSLPAVVMMDSICSFAFDQRVMRCVLTDVTDMKHPKGEAENLCANGEKAPPIHATQDRDKREIGLTKRQGEVLRFICCGRRAKEIAAELGISPRTVEHHKATMMKSLGLLTVAELVKHAVQNKLIE